MAYELEGIIKAIMDTQTFGSGFTKREFVVTTGDDKYPQDIKMEVVKDKTTLLDKYSIGQRVKVGFELRGNEHNGRYYVNVLAWRIHLADGSEPPASDAPSAPRSSAPSAPRQDRGARPDRGNDAGGNRDRGGERPPRKDWEDERRGGGGGGRREEYRGGGGRRGNAEDDIDF